MKHPHFLFGKHAVLAALANPSRKIKRVLLTKNAQAELGENILSHIKNLQLTEVQKLDAMLPIGSVHQGIALECEPLAQPSLNQILSQDPLKPLLILDQVSDPHNVGAILRTAAAFGVGAVIVTDRHAPTESGVMAKSASGACEIVPLVAVGNLVQAIEHIKKAGYWVAGLDGEAKQTLAEAKFDNKTALILGAEGKGLRRLTGEHCDYLVKIPMSPLMESLNVSNAAAIALYEVFKSISN